MPPVIDLPDSATFAAALADRRIVTAAGVALLSGLVRGFSGFGGAMIYMPLVAAIYEPRIAAVTILAVDVISSTPFAIPEVRRCNWRQVLPMAIAMAVGVPFGTWLLIALDPTVLRWCIAILVLSLVGVVASGWRYHGEPRLPVTFAVGFSSGVTGGAVQIAGPQVILYWLTSQHGAAAVRANVMVFFMLCGVALVANYLIEGLFTAHSLALSLLLCVPYLSGVGIGSYFFRGSSDRLYRGIAYGVIAMAALLSLPVLDAFLR